MPGSAVGRGSRTSAFAHYIALPSHSQLRASFRREFTVEDDDAPRDSDEVRRTARKLDGEVADGRLSTVVKFREKLRHEVRGRMEVYRPLEANEGHLVICIQCIQHVLVLKVMSRNATVLRAYEREFSIWDLKVNAGWCDSSLINNLNNHLKPWLLTNICDSQHRHHYD